MGTRVRSIAHYTLLMMCVHRASELLLERVGQLLDLVQLAGSEGADHLVLVVGGVVGGVLEVLVCLHVVGVHHALVAHKLPAGHLAPNHHFHTNTLVRLLTQEFSKGSTVDLHSFLSS